MEKFYLCGFLICKKGEIGVYILLFLLWVILNGKFTLEIAIFGIVIVTAIYIFMIKCLEYSPSGDLSFLKNGFRVIVYVFVLFWEIIKATIEVVKFVFSPNIEISPQIVFFRVPLKSEFLKSILANSITITPGTITVNVEDDIFCVHAIDYTLAQDMENMIFIKLLKAMEE